MKPSRIEAIDRVVLEAPQDCRDALRAFYGDLIGLELIADVDAALRFGSSRLELQIRFVEEPAVDPLAPRLVIGVAALDRLASELTERAIRFRRHRGLAWSDRRLILHDPAGYRIELKQEWPPVF